MGQIPLRVIKHSSGMFRVSELLVAPLSLKLFEASMFNKCSYISMWQYQKGRSIRQPITKQHVSRFPQKALNTNNGHTQKYSMFMRVSSFSPIELRTLEVSNFPAAHLALCSSISAPQMHRRRSPAAVSQRCRRCRGVRARHQGLQGLRRPT